ncbi:DUF262 domain-containing protein [Streptomyces hydrogenans]|uniref:DUF262 domain-containing protein n=1 Tax=Streptomyces hydrogenans TaxID=1873719 RepID=UPI0038221053
MTTTVGDTRPPFHIQRMKWSAGLRDVPAGGPPPAGPENRSPIGGSVFSLRPAEHQGRSGRASPAPAQRSETGRPYPEGGYRGHDGSPERRGRHGAGERKDHFPQTDRTADKPLYLLDGQQRLTSLAWVYRPHSKADGRHMDLRFDVRTEEFVTPSAVQRKDPLLIPVSTLLQENVRFYPVLSEAGVSPDDPDFGSWMQRLQKVNNIRYHQIAVITYESDDYEEVAELFARLNKGGRRLSKGDLVYSAIAARWSAGLDTMDAFHQELRDSDFDLNREAVLRLMSLLAGTGAHHIKLIGAEVDETALKEAWHAAERALRLAIDFLKGECSIPRSEQWIPDAPELRSLDRFPDFLAARRSLLANVLNELLGLPGYAGGDRPSGLRRDARRRDRDRGGSICARTGQGRRAGVAHGAGRRVARRPRRSAHHRLLRSAVPYRDGPLRPRTRRVRVPQRGGGSRGAVSQPARQPEPQRVVVLDRHGHGGASAEHPVTGGSHGRARRLPPVHVRRRDRRLGASPVALRNHRPIRGRPEEDQCSAWTRVPRHQKTGNRPAASATASLRGQSARPGLPSAGRTESVAPPRKLNRT